MPDNRLKAASLKDSRKPRTHLVYVGRLAKDTSEGSLRSYLAEPFRTFRRQINAKRQHPEKPPRFHQSYRHPLDDDCYRYSQKSQSNLRYHGNGYLSPYLHNYRHPVRIRPALESFEYNHRRGYSANYPNIAARPSSVGFGSRIF